MRRVWEAADPCAARGGWGARAVAGAWRPRHRGLTPAVPAFRTVAAFRAGPAFRAMRPSARPGHPRHAAPFPRRPGLSAAGPLRSRRPGPCAAGAAFLAVRAIPASCAFPGVAPLRAGCPVAVFARHRRRAARLRALPWCLGRFRAVPGARVALRFIAGRLVRVRGCLVSSFPAWPAWLWGGG